MIKNTFSLLAIALVLVNSSCKERYPDLENGIYAEFVTTKDTMVAKLFFEEAPVTVANFIALAEGQHPLVDEKYKGKRFYDSTTFHRVMNDFMIQGGDPTATGSGNPGFKFEDELSPNLKHDKAGILAMANPGVNANGAQFYLTEKPTPWLDGYDQNGKLKNCSNPRVYCHAVFGELVKGLNIQDSISNVKVGAGNKPVEDVVILKLNIIRKGSVAKGFNAPEVFTNELPKIKERAAAAKLEAEKKAEEAQKIKEEKIEAASIETKPLLDGYKAKAKTLASGLMMHKITPSSGVKPKTGQEVMVNYQGYFSESARLLDSNVKVIEENYGMLNPAKEQRNLYAPVKMKISPDAPLFAGFKEALASLKVGEKAYFYFPSHLAYGENGRKPMVPPNTDLSFIIEIVDIVK